MSENITGTMQEALRQEREAVRPTSKGETLNSKATGNYTSLSELNCFIQRWLHANWERPEPGARAEGRNQKWQQTIQFLSNP